MGTITYDIVVGQHRRWTLTPCEGQEFVVTNLSSEEITGMTSVFITDSFDNDDFWSASWINRYSEVVPS